MFFAVEIKTVPGFGFEGGPEFFTNVQDIASGKEARNADWAVCRHKYSAPFKSINDEQYTNIKTMFLLARGRAHTFLHKDANDFRADRAEFGTGDGVTTSYKLKKISRLAGTAATYVRDIRRPMPNATVYEDGELVPDAIVGPDGTVTFNTPPAAGATLTWSGEFRVQVRFDTDYLSFSIGDRNSLGFVRDGSISLIEVIGEEDEDAT